MPSDFQVLIDSDAFIAWMVEKDAHHVQAKGIFQSIITEDVQIVTSNLVILETATVISHRANQRYARQFLSIMRSSHIPTIYVEKALYNKSLELFAKQEKKGTSTVDCSNVAMMKKYSIPKIFSFDKVYPNRFGLEVMK
jgi:predicted nucleic acid-binding protein